jgi:poly(glycerol-phosphate) alpha-glucosyltransferase
MTVTFLTPSVSRAFGGITEIERSLAETLRASTPIDMEVVGLRDEHTEADLPEWAPLELKTVPTYGPQTFGYAPALSDTIADTGPDVVHLHSLWKYTSVAALRWARRTGRPHVITVHGNLDAWALKNSRWKKKIAGWLYERANLQEAACLKVNTEAEYRAVREYGVDTPICVIPNGVSLPPESAPSQAPWRDRIATDQRVLLFLGRIHPKKGLAELIDAWGLLRDRAPAVVEEWTVAVVGWDDGGHLPELRVTTEERELSNDIHFLGPMYGADKHAAFAHADAFVLPSFSEGMPMAVLEAWSHRLPVLLTPECNLPEGPERGAAIATEPVPERLATDLERCLGMPDAEVEAMGERGRALVEEKFTWATVVDQMHDVYRWVTGEAAPPETVRFD